MIVTLDLVEKLIHLRTVFLGVVHARDADGAAAVGAVTVGAEDRLEVLHEDLAVGQVQLPYHAALDVEEGFEVLLEVLLAHLPHRIGDLVVYDDEAVVGRWGAVASCDALLPQMDEVLGGEYLLLRRRRLVSALVRGYGYVLREDRIVVVVGDDVFSGVFLARARVLRLDRRDRALLAWHDDRSVLEELSFAC